MSAYVEYDSNNSGGSWWLTDEHWHALEAAGWKVEWASLSPVYTGEGEYVRDADGTPTLAHVEETKPRFSFAKKGSDGQFRYMGALAKKAYRTGLSLRDAADEWERITGLDATDAGCACCGQPHSFTEYDSAGEYIASGPSTEYVARW